MITYLIGVGNELMADDAIGLKVVEHIETNFKDNIKNNIQILKITHNALEILDCFNLQTKNIIIVDCALMGINPGDFKIFNLDNIKSQKNFSSITTHGFDILKIITLAYTTQEYYIPPITIIGIEPHTIKFSKNLSETLKNKFMEYVHTVMEQLQI